MTVPVSAQVPGQAGVRGTVSDADGRPLSGAELLLDGSNAIVGRTNGQGVYRIVVTSRRIQSLIARAVGFSPASREILLTDGETAQVDFKLTRVAQELAPLVVAVPEGRPVSAKMRGFWERRQAGVGKFLTREVLAKREHSTLSDVLRMTPGLQFVRRPFDCGGGSALATGRGGAVTWQPWMKCEGRPTPMPAACYLTIYVDGARLWFPGLIEPPNVDDLITVVSLEAIEVYRGPSETPTEYSGTGNACGAVLLWTRTNEGEPH